MKLIKNDTKMLNKDSVARVITLFQLLFEIFVLFGELEAIDPNITNAVVKCDSLSTSANANPGYNDKILCYLPSSNTRELIKPLPLNTSATFAEYITDIAIEVGEDEKSWILNDHKMFHLYSNLQSLVIQGNPFISSKYDDENMKELLIDELFDLPKLTYIGLWYWSHGDSYMWRFPNRISHIQFRACNYTKFDLSSYRLLKFIDFSYGYLTRMPKLSKRHFSLKLLWLLDMPDLDFSVLDIVNFCSLRDIRVYEKMEFIQNTKSYCECIRLRNYTLEFHFKPKREYYCDSDTRRKKFSKNCQDYSFEQAIQLHNSSCDLSQLPSTLNPNWKVIYPTFVPRPRNRTVYITSISNFVPCQETSCAAFVIADILLFLVIFFIDVPLCLIFKMRILHLI